MEDLQTTWEKCRQFHGHECLGLAIGVRQALTALKALDVRKAADEELLAIVETDACGVDAIQVLTGCTLGKGNLIYKDTGKQAMTLANRKTNKAVRLVMKPDLMPEDGRFKTVRDKIAGGTATEEDMVLWEEIQKERVKDFLALPAEDIMRLEEIAMPKEEKARLFQTVVCSRCDEPFSEAKARLADGKVICSECYEEYSRGW